MAHVRRCPIILPPLFTAVCLLLLSVCRVSAVWAANLESPASGSNVSGIGNISGWKCHHGDVTVRIDGGGPIRMATRMPRADTQSACQGATDNGFITQFNWAFLADGSHTVVAYDNGVEFARSTFTVATFGEEFVMGAQGECTIADFPSTGETARFVWNESTHASPALLLALRAKMIRIVELRTVKITTNTRLSISPDSSVGWVNPTLL